MPRIRIQIEGIVQGVGFRPFVYNLARTHNITGFVNNDSNGVFIEAEADTTTLDTFLDKLQNTTPPHAKIMTMQFKAVPEKQSTRFQILTSEKSTEPTALIAPDIATCDNCLRELNDLDNRRYQYPFINCTNCGPRYTIVDKIPYDRPNTSMKQFTMCPDCQAEYDNPTDRRFHAQPNACPICGPRVWLSDGSHDIERDNPVQQTINYLKKGKILAIRGVGGFHLAVDPNNYNSVMELRKRKGRAEKPFALMTRDMSTIEKYCTPTKSEYEQLHNPIRPIVLLKRNNPASLPGVAPNNNSLGFMLPYTPLHHLLLQHDMDILVMTSANYSEEPIAISNDEAIERLQNIADYFLLHDREILQRCDDSIITVTSGIPQTIRRSRGYVPYPVFIENKLNRRILAVGGELKNTIALNRDNTVFLSQHIGDLDNPSAYNFFEHAVNHIQKLLEIIPTHIACDMHPEYLSSKWAREQNLPVIEVQHHHAHLVAVLAENNETEPAIGIILDGTGYGPDHTIWGGELLIGNADSYERYAYLDPVPMPGGTAAIKQPWRMALSYLHKVYDGNVPSDLPFITAIPDNDRQLINDMLTKQINSPLTSSCGRLFDAVSALLGIKQEINYDAQAAIELEMQAAASEKSFSEFDLPETVKGALNTDYIISQIINRITDNEPVEDIALWFHHALVEIFISAAKSARTDTGINKVALSGGVYMNRLFFSYMLKRLTEESFTVLLHKELPANDGGLALGQLLIADAVLRK